MAQYRILRETDKSFLFEGEAEHPITKKERKNRGFFFLNWKMFGETMQIGYGKRQNEWKFL